MDDAPGLAIVRRLCGRAAVATAVDTAMLVALTSLIPANVTVTFRDATFASCTAALAVTPVATDTAHCTYAGSVDVPAVSVRECDYATAELRGVTYNTVTVAVTMLPRGKK